MNATKPPNARPTCYMCDERATSREHVPSQCFFPESKDLPLGIDLRRNLLTVPSCDAHNSAKSRDDQYFWQVLTMAEGLNEIGQHMIITKGARTIARRPALAISLMKTAIAAYSFDFNQSCWLPTAQVEFESKRIYSVLRYFARALYFSHFNIKWLHAVAVFPSFARFGVHDAGRQFERNWQRILRSTQSAMKNFDRIGDNQGVFYYQVLPFECGSGAVIRATFYGGITIACGFLPIPDHWE